MSESDQLELEQPTTLLIEPFYGGSHRQLMDLLQRDIPGCILLTLPASKWHWRARTSALYFAFQVPTEHSYQSLFASSVLNLAELLALRPDLAGVKKILYFHENQLVYPVRKQQDRDFQYGYNQILSCLVADVVVFNSRYNQDSFLDSIESFLKLMPNRPRNLAAKIKPKCCIISFPVDFRAPDLRNKTATGSVECSTADRECSHDSGWTDERKVDLSVDSSSTSPAWQNSKHLDHTSIPSKSSNVSDASENELVHEQSRPLDNCTDINLVKSVGMDGEISSAGNTEYVKDVTRLPHPTDGNVFEDICISSSITDDGEDFDGDDGRQKSACDDYDDDEEQEKEENYTDDGDGGGQENQTCVNKLRNVRVSVSTSSQGLNCSPLHIVWPHRWEHDKNPELFFSVLYRLHEEGFAFCLSVLGEKYQEIPEIFVQAKERLLDSHAGHWGYLKGKDEYRGVLREADVVVSTANHEFFGVAVLEAVHHGCYPVCPNRLVYPEIFPSDYLYRTPTQLFKKLKRFCRNPNLPRNHQLKIDLTQYSWSHLRKEYVSLLTVDQT